MKTLLSLETPQFYLPKPSLWKPNRKPKILPTIIKNQNQNQPSSTWKVQANGKGFASTPPATVKENAANKNSNKNNNDEDEQVPQVVFERMIARILVSVGVPLGTGLALLHLFGVAKEQNLWDVPLWLPFLTTFITFGASTLGIAYGTLSASWDPEKKGSFLGLEEAQRNWVEMWEEENDGQC
ncbi:hypothetical protein REPUB_Repub07fG0141500 [Reevesia pubescens]